MSFYVNDIRWDIEYVDPYDTRLVDKNGILGIATTDPKVRTIFIVKGLSDDFKEDVLIHELSHCFIFSHGLHKHIYKYVKPRYWDEAEECLCNLISLYGRDILNLADKELNRKRNR